MNGGQQVDLHRRNWEEERTVQLYVHMRSGLVVVVAVVAKMTGNSGQCFS